MARGPISRWLLLPTPSLRSRIPEVKTPWVFRNYRCFYSGGPQSGPQSGKWGPINAHRPESLSDLKPLEPAQSVEAPQMPAGTRPAEAQHPGPAPRGAVAGPRGKGGRRWATAGPALLGPRRGGDGSARSPMPRAGLAQWSAAAHLKAQLGLEHRGSRERPNGSPRSDSVPHRPQALAPGACFQIASSSRGRVSFRRPEIGPLLRRAALT